MTAEEYVVQELIAEKAKREKAEEHVAGLIEDLRDAVDKIRFLTGLFEFFDSYAHAYISKADPEDFDRLKAVCGFKEGDEEDG